MTTLHTLKHQANERIRGGAGNVAQAGLAQDTGHKATKSHWSESNRKFPVYQELHAFKEIDFPFYGVLIVQTGIPFRNMCGRTGAGR